MHQDGSQSTPGSRRMGISSMNRPARPGVAWRSSMPCASHQVRKRPTRGGPWSFDGDGDLLRLVLEAYRINLAWLFDRYVAITISLIEPLPHQISPLSTAASSSPAWTQLARNETRPTPTVWSPSGQR